MRNTKLFPVGMEYVGVDSVAVKVPFYSPRYGHEPAL